MFKAQIILTIPLLGIQYSSDGKTICEMDSPQYQHDSYSCTQNSLFVDWETEDNGSSEKLRYE